MGLSSISQYREPEKINTSSDPDTSINTSQLESEISEINKNGEEDNYSYKTKTEEQETDLNDISETEGSQEIDDFDMDLHKKTIAEINRCTTRYDTVRQKYLNQLEDSEKILSLLKQATQQMQHLNIKLSTNVEPNTSNQNKLPHLPFKNLEINHLKYDQIDDIVHPLDIP